MVFFNYFGNNSYSASFDGTDDYVSIGVPLGDELTFCAWIKPTANTGYAPVVAAGSSGNYNVSLNYSNGAVTFQSRAGGNPAYTSSAILSLNAWSHIAGTLDSSGSSVIYINGSSAATSATQQTPNASSKANPRIGMTPRSDNSSRFPGYIDEVAIFNRAITASEVQIIYNNKTYQSPQAMYRFENNFNDEFGSY
jgi:MSHA biogenesis protein MshQ